MKHLCSIPWTGFSNEPDGKAQPCCLFKGYITDDDNNPMYVQNYTVDEIFHSKFMKDLRQKFRNGEKPKECSTCWVDEANGYDSKRIIYNKHIKHDPKIVWEEEPKYISELQLIINNSCNLKCRSCTPSHSTQWQKEIKLISGNTGYPMVYGQSGNKKGKLWESRYEWYKGLRRLEVVGGEPFYIDQWQEIFEELISLGYSKDIDITMTTNCTIFNLPLLKKLFDNFKSFSIGISIDGHEKTYEYLRHPAKWETVYSNMISYHDFLLENSNASIQLNYTIGWLNALDTTKFYDLIKTKFPRFKIWNNIIHYPEHMPIWAAPDLLKNEISNLWENYDWGYYKKDIDPILNYMKSKNIDHAQIKANLDIFAKHDAVRNENIFESFPWLKKYI